VKYLRRQASSLRSSGSSNWYPRQQPRHDAGKEQREIAAVIARWLDQALPSKGS